jgi:hypothetical protein
MDAFVRCVLTSKVPQSFTSNAHQVLLLVAPTLGGRATAPMVLAIDTTQHYTFIRPFLSRMLSLHEGNHTPKIGRSGVTGQTCGSHRSNWCGQSPPNVIWVLPLDSSRRVDQDSYVERPNQSPYKGDMTCANSTCHVDRSDRFSTQV